MGAKPEVVLSQGADLFQPTTRRSFLRVLGMGGAVVFLPSMFAACNDDDVTGTGTNTPTTYTLDLSNEWPFQACAGEWWR